MKKQYKKPLVLFDNFSLSTNIAAGCGVSTNFGVDACGYQFAPGIFIFTQQNNGCGDKRPANGEYNGICYHNPSDTNNLYSS